MTRSDDGDPPEPPRDAPAVERASPPVLPYRPRDEPGPVPVFPAGRTYGLFGRLAFGLSLAAAACAIGGVASAGSAGGPTYGLRHGCCLGLLPWLMSAPLAAVVAARAGPGRPWAVLALLVDAMLLGLLVAVGRDG